MPILVPITLFGWIPVVLILVALLPPRRAVITVWLTAWLFLPGMAYVIRYLPDYSRLTATSVGLLLATMLFHPRLLRALRLRWFDLPMAVWTFCPIASSLTNGLGLYDGLSAASNHLVMWGLPYLIGRAYFTQLEHLRELAVGIVIGGLVYVPLCLYEVRMSPQFQARVYGIPMQGWGEMVNGGYRPFVFMSCALETGLWMAATALAGFWLWLAGSLKTLKGYSFGWMLTALVITAVLCKVTGALLVLLLGVGVCLLVKRTQRVSPAVILLCLPIFYVTTRSAGLWSGEQAVKVIQLTISQRRGESLAFRMKNEEILTARALQQPVFGWGGWNRARVIDEEGKDISITDGMWIIALGNTGLVGLVSLYTALLLPMWLLVKRVSPRFWVTPTVAPLCVLATLANLYAIDCLANAMFNPIYLLALGAATGVVGRFDRREILEQALGCEAVAGLPALMGVTDRAAAAGGPGVAAAGESADGIDPREAAAHQLSGLGRSLAERGRIPEAEEAWSAAAHHWVELASDYPDDPEIRKCWLDGLNDWAWSLVSAPGLGAREVTRALHLAEQTVAHEPECAAYWNTLGIACFRAGDPKATIRALERSVELSPDGGGTSFDHFFLALACAQDGDPAAARRWLAWGEAWMDQHQPGHAVLHRFRDEARSYVEAQPVAV
jgi:tetratricopeptide (TPR) repeat protein